jgi:hypothetical protein
MPSLVPRFGSNIPAWLGSLLTKRLGFCGTLPQLRAASEMLFNR